MQLSIQRNLHRSKRLRLQQRSRFIRSSRSARQCAINIATLRFSISRRQMAGGFRTPAQSPLRRLTPGATAGRAATSRRMKAAAIRNATEVETAGRNGESARSRVFDFAELVKARLTLLVLLTTAAGFYLGAQSPINYTALFHVVFGTAAAAAGAAALNQWWERKLDA